MAQELADLARGLDGSATRHTANQRVVLLDRERFADEVPLHRVASLDWTTAHNQEIVAMTQAAAQAMFAKHKAEREAKEKRKGQAAE